MNELLLPLPLLTLAATDPEPGAGAVIVAIILALIGIACFALWLWSLIHCIKNRQLSDTNRIVGIVLIVVLGLIGSLVYLFLPREPEPQR